VWNLENIFEIVLTNHEFECELNWSGPSFPPPLSVDIRMDPS
jgi:hypothetical protein